MRKRKDGSTYSEFVKFAKGLQPIIIPCILASNTGGRCRGCRSPCTRWELVRYGAGQYVLPKLLDLMMDRGLERVASDEAQRGPANVSEEQLARRGLHLDA